MSSWPSSLVDGGDGASGAVEDADAVVVGEAEYSIADGKLSTAQVECLAVELPGCRHSFACASVEVTHGVVVGSEHERVAAIGDGGPPPVDHVAATLVRVRVVVDAVVCLVGGECFGGVTEAEVGEGLAFPRCVLTTVLRECDGAGAAGEPGEAAACLDLGELAGITDQDHFRLGRVDPADQVDQRPCANHRGLIDDEHVVGPETGVVGSVERTLEPGDGHRWDAGTGFELAGSLGGQGDTDDGATGRDPGISGGCEGVGLAGTGDTGHDVDTVARPADAPHHHLLFVAQRPFRDRGVDEVGVGEPGARCVGRAAAMRIRSCSTRSMSGVVHRC